MLNNFNYDYLTFSPLEKLSNYVWIDCSSPNVLNLRVELIYKQYLGYVWTNG